MDPARTRRITSASLASTKARPGAAPAPHHRQPPPQPIHHQPAQYQPLQPTRMDPGLRPTSAPIARDTIGSTRAPDPTVGNIRTGGFGKQPILASVGSAALPRAGRRQRPTQGAMQSQPRRHHCGHVLILHCHVKGLAADTLLLPARHPDTFAGYEVLMVPEEEKENDHDIPVVTFEGRIDSRSYHDEQTAIDGNCAVVKNYISQAGALLKGSTSKFGRALPLMALPLPGVAEMDETDLIRDEGLMIKTLLPILYHAAEKYQVDIALCTTDKFAYGVAQVRLIIRYSPYLPYHTHTTSCFPCPWRRSTARAAVRSRPARGGCSRISTSSTSSGSKPQRRLASWRCCTAPASRCLRGCRHGEACWG